MPANISGPVVRLEQAERIFIQGSMEIRAVGGVSLEVAPGEFTVISGPSGSGKTTLLNLIGALDTPTGGRVIVEGRDLQEMTRTERSRFRRDRIGFVFQAYNLIPVLTAFENAEFILTLQGVPAAGIDHRWPGSLHVFLEYLYQSNGYDDIQEAAVDAFYNDIRVQPFPCRNYIALAARYEWHPLVTSEVSVALNIDDGSLLNTFQWTLSLSNDLDLFAGAMIPWGRRPITRWDLPGHPPELRSEYGSYPRLFFIELHGYF